ncbi:hypothetical protein D3C78_1595100 [compost metagenome]
MLLGGPYFRCGIADDEGQGPHLGKGRWGLVQGADEVQSEHKAKNATEHEAQRYPDTSCFLQIG